MFASLHTLIFLFALCFAINVQSRNVDPNVSDKCSVELEGIIFSPKNCTFEYLKRLEAKFRAGGEHLLFTSQASPFIKAFVNTYQVGVKVANPFGLATNYAIDGVTTIVPAFVYSDTAQSYINFPGFVRQPSYGNFYYAFPVFSSDGQYLMVYFILDHTRDVVFC